MANDSAEGGLSPAHSDLRGGAAPRRATDTGATAWHRPTPTSPHAVGALLSPGCAFPGPEGRGRFSRRGCERSGEGGG